MRIDYERGVGVKYGTVGHMHELICDNAKEAYALYYFDTLDDVRPEHKERVALLTVCGERLAHNGIQGVGHVYTYDDGTRDYTLL
jgi:hypothetical protein